jgi:diadenosine tetraphosphate (Ap4A) HIT family hydrolase
MSATRSRKEERIYKRYLADVPKSTCQFCAIDDASDQILELGHSFRVIHNIFGYSIWDGLDVKDHLMVVPRRHADRLSALSNKEAIELVKLLAKYEELGYNVYSRTPGSSVKSIAHMHIHLIKTGSKVKNLVFLMRKPFYYRLVK